MCAQIPALRLTVAMAACAVWTTTALAVVPIADPGGPYEAFAYEQVPLDASASFDPDGDPIVRYLWDFGDGMFYEESVLGGAPDGALDGITIHPYAPTGVYFGILEVEDLGGEVGVGFFVVDVVPLPDSGDFVAAAVDLLVVLETADLPHGLRNSLEVQVVKMLEDVDGEGWLDLAVHRIKAFDNEFAAKADSFDIDDFIMTHEVLHAISLTAATILNVQPTRTQQAGPTLEWRTYDITVPVGVTAYDLHIVYDMAPADANVSRKDWTGSVSGNEARYKTSTRPLQPGSIYRQSFSAQVPTGAKETGHYFTDANGKKII